MRNTSAPDVEHERLVAALTQHGQPTLTIGLEDLGRLFFLLEFATAVAGSALELNPFDQPNVQEAKDNTARALGEHPREEPYGDEAQLRGLVGDLAPPRYFAVMGYLPYSEGVDAAVGRLRAAVRDATGAAVSYGYGPRFLHSTGQLHKGGPATGIFLQLVHAHDDVEVPGEPYSFGRLIDSQADGDLNTLRGHGLPVARAPLPSGDLAGAIDDLAARLR